MWTFFVFNQFFLWQRFRSPAPFFAQGPFDAEVWLRNRGGFTTQKKTSVTRHQKYTVVIIYIPKKLRFKLYTFFPSFNWGWFYKVDDKVWLLLFKRFPSSCECHNACCRTLGKTKQTCPVYSCFFLGKTKQTCPVYSYFSMRYHHSNQSCRLLKPKDVLELLFDWSARSAPGSLDQFQSQRHRGSSAGPGTFFGVNPEAKLQRKSLNNPSFKGKLFGSVHLKFARFPSWMLCFLFQFGSY